MPEEHCDHDEQLLEEQYLKQGICPCGSFVVDSDYTQCWDCWKANQPDPQLVEGDNNDLMQGLPEDETYWALIGRAIFNGNFEGETQV